MLLQAKEKLEEVVVKLLAKRSNLSALTIFREITKNHKKCSLQAVYKELRKLQKSGVVVKTDKVYALRLPWAIDLISLTDEISKNYVDSLSIASILPAANKKEIWHFDSLLKMNDFWSHILLILIEKSKSKIMLGWNPHAWFHLAQTEQESQFFKALGLASGKLYLIVDGNTYLDRWTENFFDKKIVEYYFGKVGFAEDRSKYFNVIDNYLLTVKISDKTARAIDDLYKNTKSAEDMNISTVLSIFNSKTDAKICLEKNPQRADRIKKRFKRFFGIDF